MSVAFGSPCMTMITVVYEMTFFIVSVFSAVLSIVHLVLRFYSWSVLICTEFVLLLLLLKPSGGSG